MDRKKEMIDGLLESSASLETYFLDDGLLEVADRFETWVEQVALALEAAGLTEDLKRWKRADDARIFSLGGSFLLEVNEGNFRSDLRAMRAVLIGIRERLELSGSSEDLLKEESGVLSFCSGGHSVSEEARFCPKCGAPIEKTTEYYTAWDDAKKQYRVRLVFSEGAFTAEKEHLLRVMPHIVAVRSSCSCGTTLTLSDHALYRIGEQITFEAIYTCNRCKERTTEDATAISILFVAADPTDASRLRLGEELREIQEKLQLAKIRDRFVLQQRMSVRPEDLSQALLDIEPQIVHFSGHGMASGALCFEDKLGDTLPVQPNALAALFEQFTEQVNCVVLNACYSEVQANAIAKHINYVVGMNQPIGDKAAVAFAVGFYQALGAGRTIEGAYKLGCVQIRLQGIPEHLAPVLVKKGQSLQPIPSNSISSNATPKVKVERLKALLSVAEEILEQANSSLIENEKVLTPLFQDASARDRVYDDMVQLYHNQRNRGDFGRWKAFLEETLGKENDQGICSIITDLLSDVNQLYDAFYRVSPYSSVKPSKNMTIDKLSVANALNSRTRYTLDYQGILQIARWYLDYLREIVEHIGRSVGRLRAIL